MASALPSYPAPPPSSPGVATTARQWILSSMLIRVPLHYLKRRGVAAVLLGMILFAYLHEFLFHPSTNVTARSPSSLSSLASRPPYLYSSSNHDPDGPDDLDDPIGQSNQRGSSGSGWLSGLFGFGNRGNTKGDPEIAHILQRPGQRVIPLKGVDEDGMEIVDDDYLVEQHSGMKASDQSDVHQGPLQHIVAPFIQGDIVVQYPFSQQSTPVERQATLTERQQFIKAMIKHAWAGYATRAAPSDELRPVSGQPQVFAASGYNGWAATAVDSLDTLLLAGADQEYQEARRIVLEAAKEHQWAGTSREHSPNLATPDKDEDHGIAVADTIRLYLGGLLSSAELAQDQEILSAAKKVARTLLPAFKESMDGLPSSVLFRKYIFDRNSDAGTTRTNPRLRGKSSLNEVGSFQLEFRHLSRMTGYQEFSELADRNVEFFRNMKPKVRGLFPAYFNVRKATPKDYISSFGSLSHGFYEVTRRFHEHFQHNRNITSNIQTKLTSLLAILIKTLLKTYMLTGDTRFKDLYIAAVDAMHAKLISRPHDKDDPSLVIGIYDTFTDSLVPKMDHMSCFAPGMLALGARVLGRTKDMTVARGLMETCYESYAKSPTGLGAEEIAFLATPFQQGKEFERPNPQEFYVLSAGYELRPETVESLFILYRTTGNPKYQEYAWGIAQAIEKHCKTSYGYSTLANVKDSSEGTSDYMPSYFLSKTLKYLFLIFSSPDVASLDNVLFTTQGHMVPYH
ncbi:Mannosyl-oligosaccharide 1,2-alpha-mannosidase IB [Actinomortierella ambigua]|nr:Mannosyl-oligosaccharide 1,2-alpha-mannosidase IB [Actinomortierella ambigua]